MYVRVAKQDSNPKAFPEIDSNTSPWSHDCKRCLQTADRLNFCSLIQVMVVTAPVVSDIHQSLAWTAKYAKNGSFEGDPRGLSLAFCTDGRTHLPKKVCHTYSMWPITLTILNLPRQFRNLARSILLTGIIPGRSSGGSRGGSLGSDEPPFQLT